MTVRLIFNIPNKDLVLKELYIRNHKNQSKLQTVKFLHQGYLYVSPLSWNFVAIP